MEASKAGLWRSRSSISPFGLRSARVPRPVARRRYSSPIVAELSPRARYYPNRILPDFATDRSSCPVSVIASSQTRIRTERSRAFVRAQASIDGPILRSPSVFKTCGLIPKYCKFGICSGHLSGTLAKSITTLTAECNTTCEIPPKKTLKETLENSPKIEIAPVCSVEILKHS